MGTKRANSLLERMSKAGVAVGAHSPDLATGNEYAENAPMRYRIREDPDGKVLVCSEAPTLRVKIERGFTATAAAARNAAPGSIFLDGAAQGEPFMDPQRGVYNLDHHEGCVRAFTLATCEQAMVLIRKGLDLRKRDWTLYANDADLDTVLAIWVLLNHLRLCGEDPRIRAEVMPLLRLEGTIDCHGLDLLDLSALGLDALKLNQKRMQRLLGRESALKATGLWQRIDLLEYVADRLHAVDAQIYPPGLFQDLKEIEELARVAIGPNSVGVACRAEAGIYEVESQLRRIHGDRLGLIILQKGPTTYSLRQVDPTLPVTLDDLYVRLNLIDPASGGSHSPNRWGGSSEIGGSPRGTGTKLSLQEVVDACRYVSAKASGVQRLLAIGRAAFTSAAAMAIALATIPASRELGSRLGPLAEQPAFWVAAGLGLFCACFLLVVRRSTPGLYGLRRPAGIGWCLFLPLAVVAGPMGGAWVAHVPGVDPSTPGVAWLAWLAIPLLPIGSELLFRSLVHGRLASLFPIQRTGGPWSVSWPVILSTALYAACVPVLAAAGATAPAEAQVWWNVPLAGALLLGFAAGMARERAESVVAPIVLHLGAVATALLAPLPTA